MQITIQDQSIVFNVIYSKRKSFALDITPEGHITLKAPSKTPEAAILAYMESQSKGLLALQKRLDNRKVITRTKSYAATEHFLYLGKAHTLEELLDELPETEEEIGRAHV